jgi:hypothetical protein
MNINKVEMILTAAVFPTVPEADSLAIGEGRILALGRSETILPLAQEGTRTIPLQGKALLPGFIDAHTHLLSVGLKEIGWEIDLSGRSREDVLTQLANVAHERGKGEWVIARGWDESSWKERAYLTRTELDRIAPTNPVVAVRVDGHLLIANSVALAKIPPHANPKLIDRARGFVREEAAFTFQRSIEPEEETLREGLHAATASAHRLGITSVHTMEPADRLKLYLNERGKIRLRVTLYPKVPCIDALKTFGIRSGGGDDWLRIGGVKLFADGSIGAGNAALGAPYADSGETGALNYTDEALFSIIRRADEAGLQTVVHAIGDRGIEQVLRAHSTIRTSKTLRHRIEHFELPTPPQIERAARLGLHLSMQPNFVGNWSGEGSLYEKRLGKDRDQQSDPHRLVVDAGIPLAFGSDCMPISPLYGLHWAVNAPHPAQRVTVEEGIACYTTMGAHFSFEEDTKGKLAPGMLADLVILNKDPRRVSGRIADVQVETTIVGGEVVYQKES